MVRAPCCEKVGLNRGRWTAEEDDILTKHIQANGEGSWRSLPKNAGLLRCGKSCRLRWINYLRTDLKRGNITAEEEKTIVKLHNFFGNRWSLIAGHLPGRTDNEIKNYWNSHLSRKLYTFRRPSDESSSPVTTILHIPPPPKRRSRHRDLYNIISSDPKADGKSTPNPNIEKEQGEKDAGNLIMENEASFSTTMGEEDGDLGPYDWLDGEIMRLNKEILERGNISIKEQMGENGVMSSEEENGCCSSSINSGLEDDEWLNWVWKDEDEGCLETREFEEISCWLWGSDQNDNDGEMIVL